jgi:hypothetical protein
MCVPSPVQVTLPGPAAEIAFGDVAALVRLTNGQLWSWGVNSASQIGNPAAGPIQSTPIQVVNFP